MGTDISCVLILRALVEQLDVSAVRPLRDVSAMLVGTGQALVSLIGTIQKCEGYALWQSSCELKFKAVLLALLTEFSRNFTRASFLHVY